jgi:hypothetical protein
MYFFLFSVSPKNNPDVNKEKGQSPSAHNATRGRPVRVCQPAMHSQEIVPLFNNDSSVASWPGDYPGHCITFAILSTNLLILPMN